MKFGVLLCSVSGHKWRPDPETFDSVAYLKCTRCERRRAESTEMRQIEGFGRGRRVR